jgi:hypothetical protein
MAVRKLGMVVSLWVGMVGGVEAGHICTLISDVNMSAILYQRGECSARVSPASTFKLALSLMGFDSVFFMIDTALRWPISREILIGEALTGFNPPILNAG